MRTLIGLIAALLLAAPVVRAEEELLPIDLPDEVLPLNLPDGFKVPEAPKQSWYGWDTPSVGETACLASSLALIWLDVGVTRAYLHNEPTAFESNPILGSHPSQGKVTWIGGVLPSVALTAVWLALPSKIRYAACGTVTAGEVLNLTGIALSTGQFAIRF